MKKLWHIALNDIRIAFSERSDVLIFFAAPVAIMLVIGFGTAGYGDGAVMRLDVLDLDRSELSAELIEAIAEGSEAVTVCDLLAPDPDADCDLPDEVGDPEELIRQRLESQVSYAAIVIEAGFEEKLLAGEQAHISFRSDPTLTASAVIRRVVEAAATRVGGAVTAASAGADAMRESGLADDEAVDELFSAIYAGAANAWESPPATVEVTMPQQSEEEEWGYRSFSQAGPGTATMFVMMNVLGVAALIVRERQQWTFQRLMVMPVRRWVIMAGKLLARYSMGLIQFAILLSISELLGAGLGGNAAGVVLLALTYTLAVTSMALFLAAIVRSPAQAEGITLFVTMTLAPLGGAWWPLELVPRWMQVIGHVSPIAWALDGFHELSWFGGSVIDILPSIGALLLYAAVFFALGVWRFRYE